MKNRFFDDEVLEAIEDESETESAIADEGLEENEQASFYDEDNSLEGELENIQENDGDSSESDILLSEMEEETVEITVEDSRPFLETPFNEYTVTEGLLLVTVVFMALASLLALFKSR